MKKILFSSLAIVAVVAMAGVASWAMWSDTDTSANNVLSAGSMTLEFNSEDGSYDWNKDMPNNLVVVEDAFPGDEDEGTIQVRNAGDTVDGTLSVSLGDVTDVENGWADPERAAPADPSPSEGELCQYVEVMWTVDGASSSWKNVTSNPIWDFGGAAVLEEGGLAQLLTGHYRVSTNADNNTMTDQCHFDINVHLDQVIAP